MAHMLYRVSFEFRLTRRVPWVDDVAVFYGHVEDVRAKVEAHELIEDVRVISDVADSQLTFDFLIDATRYQLATAAALRIVRDAIEGCGGRHFGLDTVQKGLLASAGAGSGLETPIWQHRRTLVDVAA